MSANIYNQLKLHLSSRGYHIKPILPSSCEVFLGSDFQGSLLIFKGDVRPMNASPQLLEEINEFLAPVAHLL